MTLLKKMLLTLQRPTTDGTDPPMDQDVTMVRTEIEDDEGILIDMQSKEQIRKSLVSIISLFFLKD